MTMGEFCKIINERTRVRVFDRWGHVGTYEVKQLKIYFNDYRYIIEIKASDCNMIDIILEGSY